MSLNSLGSPAHSQGTMAAGPLGNRPMDEKSRIGTARNGQSVDVYVSIVICTYNRADHLRGVLAAFRDQAVDEPAEILVVDNNSSDETKAVVERLSDDPSIPIPIIYVFEPQQGLSAARNKGIEVARGEIIAFLDDDATPDPGWLTALTRYFKSNAQVSAVGGPVRPDFEIDPPKWLTPGLHGLYSLIDLGDDVSRFPRNAFPIGANMAFRRKEFDDLRFSTNLGRKGEALLSREETDLFLKFQREEEPIAYIEGMSVRHFVPKSRMTKHWIYDRSYNEGVSIALSMSCGGTISLIFRCLFYVLINYIPRPKFFKESMVCHNARLLLFVGTLLHVFPNIRRSLRGSHA
jgi:GT2 family glycosyltransferase